MSRAPDHDPTTSRLLRFVLPLDAVASSAMVVVALAAVPVLVLWGTSTLIWVLGLLLIGYAVALAAMGATMAGVLVRCAGRRSREVSLPRWLVPTPVDAVVEPAAGAPGHAGRSASPPDSQS